MNEIVITDTFIPSIVKIQSELKVPKKQYNKFGNYSFRNVDDILEAVKPLLKKENLLLIITDSIECNKLVLTCVR